jgi:hypothetical protein
MVRFSIALSSFLINTRRSSYFCVVGAVKTGFSSSGEAAKGSVKLLLLLLFNTLLLLLLLMLFFLSSTHPFNGLESSVMDKPNVPATIPPIKKGKFSDMTSKMSSFSLLLIRPKVVLVNTERCGVCLFLSRTFAPLAEDDDDEKEEEEEEDDVVANVVVVVVLIVRAVSVVFLSRILWTCTSLWNSARRRVAPERPRGRYFSCSPSLQHNTRVRCQKAVSKKEKRKKRNIFRESKKKELFVSRQSSV